MLYSVIVCKNLDKQYTYESDMKLYPGQIVEIPLRNSLAIGIIDNEITNIKQEYKVKPILRVLPYSFSEKHVKFIKWCALYTANKIGQMAALFINKEVLENHESRIKLNVCSDLTSDKIKLNPKQLEAYKQIKESGGAFNVSVLRGITGSGKTMVYLKHAIDHVAMDEQVLIMIPEIALNEHISAEIKEISGDNVFVWNSSITKQQKREIWKGVYSGEIKFIVGTRSSIFLPFKKLGLIVVDEEHDNSYKQEATPIYNAKNLAIMLSKLNNSQILLASATISVDILANLSKKEYKLIELKQRFGGAQVPKITFVSHEFSISSISADILESVNTTLSRGEQALIYVNRLGYAPITVCKKCKKKYTCPNCDISLVLHKSTNKYKCHYCDFSIPASEKCIYCNEAGGVQHFGLGIEKIKECVEEHFAGKEVFIASSDTLNTKSKIREFVSMMSEHKIDIVIGTQIMSKGHNFKNLTFCGIIDIDFSMNSIDIRSVEKTYQMVHQISGRTGRGDKPGEVIIQTSLNKNSVSSLLLKDFTSFADNELENRRQHDLPPFCKLVSIILSSNNEDAVENAAYNLIKTPIDNKIEVLGPIPSPISRIKKKSRWRILLKSHKDMIIQRCVFNWIKAAKIDRRVSVQIDVDPLSFI